MDTPLGAVGPVAPGAAPVPRDSPEGEMCLQEMEGSGFPVARHTRVTLLPSFTTMSLEIRNIFGETATRQGERCQGNCCLGIPGSPSGIKHRHGLKENGKTSFR